MFSLVTTLSNMQVVHKLHKYSITIWIVADNHAAKLHCIVHWSETVNLYL